MNGAKMAEKMTVEIDALGQNIPNVQVLPHCALWAMCISSAI